MSEVISLADLRALVDQWIGAKSHVVGPRKMNDRTLYGRLDKAEQLVFDDPRPRNSIKELLFPRHEKLYGYQLSRKKVALSEEPLPEREQIVIGARPCDAACGPILDHVFNWDYVDAAYNRRRELTTIITLACTSHDAQCFCTSVGSAPDDTRGSDVMLFDLGDGQFEVRCVTDKGRRLFAGKTQTADRQATVGPGPEKRFLPEVIEAALKKGFEDPRWAEMSRRCLGCGACAFTCPTCHCFDIVDEGAAGNGVRARNWDACQFSMFTLHASGHNPRNQQGQRQRQRLFHKFQIYPEKFGTVLCTGCGNCARNCPAGLGILPVLTALK